MLLRAFDLNLRHLLATSAIVRHGSMSAAAEAVSLSQPALTQGLAKLEARLGVALFLRKPDGMAPTEEGRLLAERVDAAFRHLARATRGPGRGFARPERLMTATQLSAFLALADAGSFVAAAEATGLSQPAIHRAVREIEQILGRPLAERRGRGVALTAAGRTVARGFRLAAAEIMAATAEIAAGPANSGPIAIGAMPLCRAQLLPRAIARFVREGEPPHLTIVEGSWRDLVEPLRDGVIDFMIGALRDNPAPPDLDQTPLFEDRLVIVARPGHPLAGLADPPLADLARHGWIVGPSGSPLRSHWERLFTGAALPDAPIECGSVMTIREILRETDCLTLLSPDQIRAEVTAGLLAQVGQPLRQSVRTIGLVARAGWRPTRHQQRLLDHLHAVAGERSVPLF